MYLLRATRLVGNSRVCCRRAVGGRLGGKGMTRAYNVKFEREKLFGWSEQYSEL